LFLHKHIKELENLSTQGENELNKKVVELSRNNMMLKITESNLSRKNDAIMEREKILREEIGEMKVIIIIHIYIFNKKLKYKYNYEKYKF